MVSCKFLYILRSKKITDFRASKKALRFACDKAGVGVEVVSKGLLAECTPKYSFFAPSLEFNLSLNEKNCLLIQPQNHI
jgi:hypothetical protein